MLKKRIEGVSILRKGKKIIGN